MLGSYLHLQNPEKNAFNIAMFSTLCRMGTHPSGHAALASKQHLTLAEWLKDHPEALGQEVLQHFGAGLPFLLKVWVFPILLLHQLLLPWRIRS